MSQGNRTTPRNEQGSGFFLPIRDDGVLRRVLVIAEIVGRPVVSRLP